MDFVLGDHAVFQLTHQGGCAEADFIHAIAPIHHHSMLSAQTLQRTHLDAHQIGMEHPHQDVGRTGGVGERAEDVENGFDAQLAPHRGHVLHGRVVVGRKHEAQAGLRNALGNPLRAQVDVDTQALQHIGTAAFAADAAPAVLADTRPGGGGHKHGTGGNVEGVRAIAPGAHDVHQVGGVGHMNLGGKLAHHLRGGGDFTDGFLFHAQAGDECGHHHGRHFAAHDQPHEVQHFIVKNFAVLDGALQRLLRGDFGGVGHGGLRNGCGNVMGGEIGCVRCGATAQPPGASVSASLMPKPTNITPATRSSQCRARCTAPRRRVAQAASSA